MTENKFYKKLQIQTTLLNDIKELINDGGQWGEKNSFKIKQISHKVAMGDPFLKELYSRHPFIIGVLKLDPHQVYNWHVDGERTVGINLLPQKVNSHCLFITNVLNTYVFDTIELKYDVGEWVVFNTAEHHMVINFEEPRYMVTILFTDNPTYEQIISEI